MVDIIIGIAGASGSGKTTIANRIHEPLGDDAVLITHDSYYKNHDELDFEQRSKINYDHPNSLESDLLVKHLMELKEGKSINIPQYDYTQHQRKPDTINVKPCSVILVEGILIFTEPKLRELMDLKIYVDTDPDICLIRRINRDVKKRNRSLDSVIEQYINTVKPMYHEFVEPSKRYADIIIPEGGYNEVANGIIINRAKTIINKSKKEEN
ncbi:MAG: uridine kinase [Eubacteriales bacterium]